MCIFALIILFFLPWVRVQWMFRRLPAIEQSRSLSFSSEGLHLESEAARGDYKWWFFHRIVETPKVFMFIVGRGGTYVPKRCLSTPGEIEILRS